ncbi:AbrB/MazE/SpoVT family DNA-binding domain-containing protein [Rickettsiaceae bacterium]|nr:AbrB/MazE/SpoVT family DNA-binding domain-containing protein [Rickettsiaceae bacterium]
MKNFKLTEKYQATIPSKVRKFLNLHKGDTIGFEIQNNKVLLKKTTTISDQYLKSLNNLLSEWSSKEDEEAYYDL